MQSITVEQVWQEVSALYDCTGFEVFAFPLKIRTDSSPVRVVARVFE